MEQSCERTKHNTVLRYIIHNTEKDQLLQLASVSASLIGDTGICYDLDIGFVLLRLSLRCLPHAWGRKEARSKSYFAHPLGGSKLECQNLIYFLLIKITSLDLLPAQYLALLRVLGISFLPPLEVC